MIVTTMDVENPAFPSPVGPECLVIEHARLPVTHIRLISKLQATHLT